MLALLSAVFIAEDGQGAVGPVEIHGLLVAAIVFVEVALEDL